MKLAVVQVADTGPLESLAVMLNAVGYEARPTSREVNGLLRRIGCDTVLENEDLVRRWGYEKPQLVGPAATPEDLNRCDLFVDVKAHRSYPKVVARFPRLKNRILWYRINGGRPEHVVNSRGDHGDEVHPPCPVLTPNRWYRDGFVYTTSDSKTWETKEPCPSYGVWPPFHAFPTFTSPRRGTEVPVCLIHNVTGWGYHSLVDPVRRLGVRVHGVDSPDGLISRSNVPDLLAGALASVHLKSNDAPGYALYEAIAAGCPLVIPRRLIWRCRMGELFREGETCLCFDRESHDPLSQKDVETCTTEIGDALSRLKTDPGLGDRLAHEAKASLTRLCWSPNRSEDVEAFKRFLSRHFH